MPRDPVPAPRPGGDDDEAGLLPQPRSAGDESMAGTAPAGDVEPATRSDPDVDVEAVADDDPAPAAGPATEIGPAPVLADPRPAPDDELDPASAVLGDPRPALDDARGSRARVVPPVARVYADGSALVQYVAGSPSHDEWLEWTRDHEDELITTPLGLTELRRLALPAGLEARGVARDVEARVTVVRFSDQTLRAATKVSGVLPPFTALHIGAALAHPGVAAVATYEIQLARVAALHGLLVVSPGLAPFWWESDD